MTEKKDAVEFTVLTDYDESEVEVNPALVSVPVEGLEIIKAYVFTGKADLSTPASFRFDIMIFLLRRIHPFSFARS